MTETGEEWSDLTRLLAEVQTGDKVAISRLITMLERGSDGLLDVVERATPGKAYTIGVTGPPGAGKSTLISKLIASLSAGRKLAVLCVDPSSAEGGGAILGDRIRLRESIDRDSGVFVRSFSSGRSWGGISPSIFLAMKALSLGGYGTVIVEGVGAGQLDVKPFLCAHTRVLVLTPALGDLIQAIKSGVMEMADIYVINKADMPEADLARMNVAQAISLGASTSRWVPPVVATAASDGTGIDALADAIRRHEAHLRESGEWTKRGDLAKITELKESLFLYLSELVDEIMISGPGSEGIVGRYLSGDSGTAETLKSLFRRLKEVLPDNA